MPRIESWVPQVRARPLSANLANSKSYLDFISLSPGKANESLAASNSHVGTGALARPAERSSARSSLGIAEIESQWTARDREKALSGPARVFLSQACPERS